MNDEFYRFPHTPHLAWLSEGNPRGDKLLDTREAGHLLSGEVVVEEKLDGANVGISVGPDGVLLIQNRGQYIEPPYRGQFSRLSSWLALHQATLIAGLGPDLILFGEWCAARHSIHYTSLPDWFVVFDVYDTAAGRFWSTLRRNELAGQLGMPVVPCLFSGSSSLDALKAVLSDHRSAFAGVPMEGVVIRSEDRDWLIARAKLVKAEFIQAIDEHWSRRGIEWNSLGSRFDEPTSSPVSGNFS